MRNKKLTAVILCVFAAICLLLKTVQIYDAMKIKGTIKESKKVQTLKTGINLYEKLPELLLKDKNDSTVNLNDKKDRNLIITFWNSSSYDSCEQVRAFYVLRETFKKYENTECIIINNMGNDENKEKELQFLKDKGIEFETLFDYNSSVYNELNLKVMPSTIVVNKDGIIIKKHEGIIYDPGILEAYIESSIYGKNKATEDFILNRLLDNKGGIKAQYGQGQENILSESEGLMLEYGVLNNNEQIFTNTLNYINNNMRNDELVTWQIQNGEKSRVNAAIDDLRIYGAMKDGYSKFEMKEKDLKAYRKAIYKYNTDHGKLIDFYDFQSNEKASRFTLCYGDFRVIKSLAEDDIRFYKVYKNAMDIVAKGYINDNFPLYYSYFDYNTNTYAKDELNTAEAMVTLLHLAEADEIKEESIKWLKEKIKNEGILGRYTVDGEVVHGYEYESTASYAIAAMIGNEINDFELVDLAVEKMEKMRIDNTASEFNGAFGNTDGSGIYSFDQCMPLVAYCQLKKSQ